MKSALRLGVALAGLAAASALTVLAQEGMKSLGSASAGHGDLTIVIDGDVRGRTFTVRDGNKKIVDKLEWNFDLPLVRQYEVPAGIYNIELPGGPLYSVALEVQASVKTTLKITPVESDGILPALQVTAWQAFAPKDIDEVIRLLTAAGGERLIQPVRLEDPSGSLYFDTEPPWPIPPKPRPPPPQ